METLHDNGRHIERCIQVQLLSLNLFVFLGTQISFDKGVHEHKHEDHCEDIAGNGYTISQNESNELIIF